MTDYSRLFYIKDFGFHRIIKVFASNYTGSYYESLTLCLVTPSIKKDIDNIILDTWIVQELYDKYDGGEINWIPQTYRLLNDKDWREFD
ncbi:hypothetical protein FD723_40175 (plasmid) [Nostoc sp. C052]|uniref:hypothetical protein n=1 Tax=Nostoc sp. C052 TaxID=2576902 RepID=UPI0015C3670C|nr:hypothetical protein [Nostoc sp. C052]QLE46431.1 hypothetical protein FD723_40175 [Nostoc sp. C052]